MKKAISLLVCLIFSISLYAAPPVRVYSYSSGQVIDPDQVSANENAIFSYLQAGIDTVSDNSITSAKIVNGTITTSDILDGTIANADISSSAAIAGSKLDLSAPGIIGGTTPAAGTFTTLTANTSVTTAALSATADLDIGAFELRAQTFESDVTTGTAPFTIASTTVSTNLNADLLDGYSSSTTAAATTIPVTGGDTYLPDDIVDTTAIKTASGEVSTTSVNTVQTALPGGTYGFYPQLKSSDAANAYIVTHCGYSGNAKDPGQTYATQIGLKSDGTKTIYAQQRYVTASGLDKWIFLLLDKTTKDIIATWSADDHPSYGNGGDPELLPHPFTNYDPALQEIVLLDKASCEELKTGNKSIATLLNEDYKVSFDTEEPYVPLHSGKFTNQEPVMIETIPDYIKVRKAIKLTGQEKEDKEARKQQKELEITQEKQKKESDRQSAKDKLKTLGLTDKEIASLFE